VLDGALRANHTAESAAQLARAGKIPPIIVVGISNLSDDSRNRDLTPPTEWRDSAGASPSTGARRFLSFLETELIPLVESEYRTSRPRTLAGWSRGGLFVLYSQIAAPPLFDARFGLSPFVWGDEDQRAVARFEHDLTAVRSDSAFLYLSLGNEETQTLPAFRQLVRTLETRAPSTFRWKAEITPSADHDSNPRLSAPVALCTLFATVAASTCQ
jgi:predicted alpha/beta superfamily hydrolase